MTPFNIKNINDISQIESTGIDDRLQATNTYDLIQYGASLQPDKIALSFIASGNSYDQPIQLSYQNFLQQINACANLFSSLGTQPTDVISYLLPNLPITHAVLWGAETAGIANPINPLLEADTIKNICIAANTSIIVALGDSEIWQKVLKIKDDIPSLKTILCISESQAETDQILNFNQQLQTQPKNQLNFHRTIHKTDIASLYHTGGTTGTPKLAKRTHYNEVCMAWMINTAGGMEQNSQLLCGLPLFHVNATTITGLCPFSIGAHVIILSPAGYRDTSIIVNFYKIVEFYQATFFSTVPTVLSGLLQIPVGDCQIDSLKYAICGAAPLSIELFKRFEQHTQMKILEGYGLTEGACASAVNPKDGERKVGSVGIRLPYQKIKIAQINHNEITRESKIDEIGHILIQGPNVFQGYVEEIHNKNNWFGDWFDTGDLGKKDKDGFYWLTGRIKELIIRGGHNIDPLMIEEVFYQLEQVKYAAAIACPHPRVGEIPVVFIELQPDTTLSIDQLMQHAENTIGERAAIPKEIHLIKQIPLTLVGKIFKPKLRWQITQAVFQRELDPIDTIDQLEIQVSEDKHHGTRVDIIVQSSENIDNITATIKQKLSGYTLYYELHCTKN
ncbi:MAG: acyl-CoA synthetase [Methylococcales bacterium]|jgi:fatty-acyl-CoA synthase|nr:acyl-CoA synthetase [Methylococcales bacterium]MBT7410918.1 acyl-CoA synthetase [Methylococcales bacterium]